MLAVEFDIKVSTQVGRETCEADYKAAEAAIRKALQDLGFEPVIQGFWITPKIKRHYDEKTILGQRCY